MATGASKDQAQTDLCRAMADRKIHVRVRIAPNHYERGRVFSDGNVGVPPHLNPHDFDWVQSRPLAQWSIGPMPGQQYSWLAGWQNRPLDLIELSTSDVTKILCEGASADDNTSGALAATAKREAEAIKALASHLKGNPQLRRADAAAWCRGQGFDLSGQGFQNRIWPRARDQAGLSAKAHPGRKKNRRANALKSLRPLQRLLTNRCLAYGSFCAF
jgi:hypothetical protein